MVRCRKCGMPGYRHVCLSCRLDEDRRATLLAKDNKSREPVSREA
jgi:hypothetical protein